MSQNQSNFLSHQTELFFILWAFYWVLKESYSSLHFSAGNMFQDSHPTARHECLKAWIVQSSLYIVFFSYTYIPMIKFNLLVRQSSRLTTISNNKTDIALYCNKSYMNVVSLANSLLYKFNAFSILTKHLIMMLL